MATGLPSTAARGGSNGKGGARARARSFPFHAWDLPLAAKRVSAGLPTDSLTFVQRLLDLSNLELARVLSVSPRTLSRRRKEDLLPPEESERVYRVGRLAQFAADVLGGADEARAWLREPNFALGEAVPLEVLRTEPGAELVERVLHQVAHGIAS